ncbi:MAG: hypothetical protein ACK5N8_06235 [Alphaproteobacteria bacterium]
MNTELKEIVIPPHPDKPFSPLNIYLSELKELQEQINPLSRSTKKTKNRNKIFKILSEIRENYLKSVAIKKQIQTELQKAKADEERLLTYFDEGNPRAEKALCLLKKHGLICSTKHHGLLTKVEKMIIRADFNGTISAITDEKLLSPLYLEHKNGKKEETYEYKDYSELSESKAWALFSQFKNFKNLETFVKKHLYSISYPPQKIKKLVVEDFIDIFHQEQLRKSGRLFLGAKKSFVKDFINKNEPQFKEILRNVGVDEKYLKALIVSMKTKGNCGKLTLYDNKGNLIDGPALSVHHKVAVQDASSQDRLAELNLFQNLCLTIDDPYHSKILHRLDKTQITDEGSVYQQRIEFADKNVIFMGGLSKLHQIYYDYENDERSKRASEKAHQTPKVNIKMNGKPESQIIDSYEQRMKRKGKTPIDLRTYMKIRNRQSNR